MDKESEKLLKKMMLYDYVIGLEKHIDNMGEKLSCVEAELEEEKIKFEATQPAWSPTYYEPTASNSSSGKWHVRTSQFRTICVLFAYIREIDKNKWICEFPGYQCDRTEIFFDSEDKAKFYVENEFKTHYNYVIREYKNERTKR